MTKQKETQMYYGEITKLLLLHNVMLVYNIIIIDREGKLSWDVYLSFTFIVKYSSYAVMCSGIPSLCYLTGSWELNSLIMNHKKHFRNVNQR